MVPGPAGATWHGLQRGRGRTEKLMCAAKGTGLSILPSGPFIDLAHVAVGP